MGMKSGMNTTSVLIEKYINSAYDAVKTVADNLADVIVVAGIFEGSEDVNLQNIARLVDNYDNIDRVATHLETAIEFSNIYYSTVTAPTLQNTPTLSEGDLWYDTASKDLHVYNNAQWVSILQNVSDMMAAINTAYQYSDLAAGSADEASNSLTLVQEHISAFESNKSLLYSVLSGMDSISVLANDINKAYSIVDNGSISANSTIFYNYGSITDVEDSYLSYGSVAHSSEFDITQSAILNLHENFDQLSSLSDTLTEAVESVSNTLNSLGNTAIIADNINSINIVSDDLTLAYNIEYLGKIVDDVTNTINYDSIVATVTTTIDYGNITDSIEDDLNSSNIINVATNLTTIEKVADIQEDIIKLTDNYLFSNIAPTPPITEGSLWYNPTANVVQFYNGTSWDILYSGDPNIQLNKFLTHFISN